MPFPHWNSRQWFWVLVGLALVWGVVGTRTAVGGPKEPQSFMEWAQFLMNWPLDTLITPGRFIAGKGEAALVSKAEKPFEKKEVAELQARIVALEQALEVTNQQRAAMQQRLKELEELRFAGIMPAERVSAHVNGYGGGAGSSLISIDRGRNHGVVSPSPAQPVVAVISGSCIVGRVTEAYPMTARVQLLTDGRSGVRAKIVRRSDRSLAVKECFVEGTGSAHLVSESVEILTKVEPGDLVELADLDWPRPLQSFIIGHVVEVRPGTSPFRSSIRIAPAVEMNKLQDVDVIVRR